MWRKKLSKEERKSLDKDDPRKKSYLINNKDNFLAAAEALHLW